jgi:hypothetical protein
MGGVEVKVIFRRIRKGESWKYWYNKRLGIQEKEEKGFYRFDRVPCVGERFNGGDIVSVEWELVGEYVCPTIVVIHD